jgi:uncharacterized membrane protein (UPF0127 family)
MFSRSRFPGPFLLAAVVLFAGCSRADPGPAAAAKSVDDRFAIRIGEHTVQLQIAALPAEQQQGLMHRRTMGMEEGMLFVFAAPQPQSFWMRNTVLPLDIGFFDAAGELKEIYPMYPLDERPVSSHSRGIQYCLEMNQGWFKQSGVSPGAKLDLAAVTAALRARGLKAGALEEP